MRFNFTNLIVALSLLLSSNFVNGQNLAFSVKNVNAVEFEKAIKTTKGIILDVRTPNEFSRGHIKGAINFNIGDRLFVQNLNTLSKEKAIYVYCLTGSRSAYATKYMVKNGFQNTYNLLGGTLAWTRSNFKLEQSKTAVTSKSITYNSSSFEKLINSKKVVLVDFHAVWCAPCKKMSPDIEKLKKTYKNKALVTKVDIDANKELGKEYQVTGVPALLIFKNGKKVWQNNGALTYPELQSTLEKYL